MHIGTYPAICRLGDRDGLGDTASSTQLGILGVADQRIRAMVDRTRGHAALRAIRFQNLGVGSGASDVVN